MAVTPVSSPQLVGIWSSCVWPGNRTDVAESLWVFESSTRAAEVSDGMCSWGLCHEAKFAVSQGCCGMVAIDEQIRSVGTPTTRRRRQVGRCANFDDK